MNTLVILGPPGAGKGTQAVRLSEHLGSVHLSTGAIFRSHIKAGSELGRTAESYILKGEYVPDEITDAMVESQICQIDGGILLDGYPRTIQQVYTLDRILADNHRQLDVALNLAVNEDLLVGRMLERAQVEQRADDTEEVFRRRLAVYYEQTRPVVEHYDSCGCLVNVDGSGSVEQVWDGIRAALKI